MNEKMKSSAYCYETTNQDLVRCLFALSFLFFFFPFVENTQNTTLRNGGGFGISFHIGSIRGR